MLNHETPLILRFEYVLEYLHYIDADDNVEDGLDNDHVGKINQRRNGPAEPKCEQRPAGFFIFTLAVYFALSRQLISRCLSGHWFDFFGSLIYYLCLHIKPFYRHDKQGPDCYCFFSLREEEHGTIGCLPGCYYWRE